MAASIVANPQQLRSAAVTYRRRSEWCAELSDALQSIPMPPMPAWVAAELRWRLSSAGYALRDIRNQLWDDAVGLEKTAWLFEESQRGSGRSAMLWSAMQFLDKHSLLAPLVTPTFANSAIAAIGHLAGGTVIDLRDYRGLHGTTAPKPAGDQLGGTLKSLGGKAQEAVQVISSALKARPGENEGKDGPQTGGSGDANAQTSTSNHLAAKSNEIVDRLKARGVKVPQGIKGNAVSREVTDLGGHPENVWDWDEDKKTWVDTGIPSDQCKAFVNDMLRLSGVEPGGGYYPTGKIGTAIIDESSQPHDLSSVLPGDVIQIYDPDPTRKGGYWPGMHSAIVVGGWDPRSGGFAVLDGNFDLDLKVQVHTYNPWTANPDTSKNGLKVVIWRPR